jgi:hypothetical protein
MFRSASQGLSHSVTWPAFLRKTAITCVLGPVSGVMWNALKAEDRCRQIAFEGQGADDTAFTSDSFDRPRSWSRRVKLLVDQLVDKAGVGELTPLLVVGSGWFGIDRLARCPVLSSTARRLAICAACLRAWSVWLLKVLRSA